MRALWLVVLLGFASCVSAPQKGDENALAREAQDHLEAGDAAAARSLLLGKARHSPRLNAILGDACYELGEYQEAEGAWFTARSSGQAATRYRANLGLGQLALARHDGLKARLRFTDALESAISSEDRDAARLGLAMAAFESGDLKGAEAAKSLVKRDSTALRQLNQALARARVEPAWITELKNRPRWELKPAPVALTTTQPVAPPRTAPVTTVRPGPFSRIQVIGRSDWRARAMGNRGRPGPLGRVKRITIHHTATPGTVGTGWAENAQRMRSIQSTHQRDRGWADIGYHYVIDAAGRIWEGRELRYQGAHAGNSRANAGNIGIALMGDFGHRDPPAMQLAALEKLTVHLASRHGVRPERITGHNDVAKEFRAGGTECPGRHLSRRLPGLRSAVRRAR